MNYMQKSVVMSMKIYVIALLSIPCILCSHSASAQTTRDVASTPLKSPHISITSGGFLPIADLNARFGAFATIGASFGVKTEKNKYFGFRLTYLTGAEAQEPELLSNLLTTDGEIIDNEGDVARITVTGRGAIIGVHGGTIIPFGRTNINSGLFLRGGIGSIHHKIGFDFTENHISQLEDPYLPGYDRLSWGGYVSGFVGYWHMDTYRRVNAYGGIFGFAARTTPLRTMNFDTGIPDLGHRFDAGIGIELGWVLHIYKRAPKEYWY
ncbi:MAG: hypothetical protein COA49_06510 [Bacteroidetes bacterium]|nr:MAG: hypothetical protein COA49_06510 [Bacteroidota bacterium]